MVQIHSPRPVLACLSTVCRRLGVIAGTLINIDRVWPRGVKRLVRGSCLSSCAPCTSGVHPGLTLVRNPGLALESTDSGFEAAYLSRALRCVRTACRSSRAARPALSGRTWKARMRIACRSPPRPGASHRLQPTPNRGMRSSHPSAGCAVRAHRSSSPCPQRSWGGFRWSTCGGSTDRRPASRRPSVSIGSASVP